MLSLMKNGRRLEYQVTGEGKPFVFLHGMGGSVKQIESAYVPLKGVQLININQQGHGNSEADWENYDFEHLADDVVSLMDELKIEKVYLGGISMGAAVSLNIAVRYPERIESLLLIRNAWTIEPMSEDVQKAYYDMGLALKENSIDAFYDTEGWNLVKEPSVYTRNAFVSPFADEACLKYWEKYLILPKKTPIHDVKQLEKLSMPVYILANKNDFCHPFEMGVWMHEHIKGSAFLEIPDKDIGPAEHKKLSNDTIKTMIFGREC